MLSRGGSTQTTHTNFQYIQTHISLSLDSLSSPVTKFRLTSSHPNPIHFSINNMSTGELLNIELHELQFPFELKKQISCTMQLLNKTDHYVAFKVKTTNPKKYCVRPNSGVVLPRSTCNVTITMQAQKEAPPDMQCRNKYLLQSAVASTGATLKDITPELLLP